MNYDTYLMIIGILEHHGVGYEIKSTPPTAEHPRTRRDIEIINCRNLNEVIEDMELRNIHVSFYADSGWRFEYVLEREAKSGD